MYNDNNCSFNPLAVLEPIKEPRRYTLAEYLKREERAKEPNEYYNGFITKRTMAKGPHNLVVGNITGELKIASRTSGKKYSIFGSQQKIYLPEFNFGLYPDVAVVAETPQYWDKNHVLLINPLLIVEVLSSSSTSKYDRTGKFDEYKSLPSFKEYLLIDPNKCRIEIRFRDTPNTWRETIYKNLSDIVKLESIDCEINVDFIYENITFQK